MMWYMTIIDVSRGLKYVQNDIHHKVSKIVLIHEHPPKAKSFQQRARASWNSENGQIIATFFLPVGQLKIGEFCSANPSKMP